MPIVASYMVPHPPMILSEIGEGREKQVQKTIDAYLEVAEEISKIEPDTIVISSPHAPLYSDCFYMTGDEELSGSFHRFGVDSVSFLEKQDVELIDKIEELSKKKHISVKKLEAVELDHGVMVPLYFIRKKYPNSKIIVVGLSTLSLVDHYQFGQVIQKAVLSLNRKVVMIASGDLSHKLQSYGPYGFVEEGPIYDDQLMNLMRNADFLKLFQFDSNFLDKASECGHRSFTIMAGVLDRYEVDAISLSHETVTGVGYGICKFYPKKQDDNRNILDQYLELEKRKMDEILKKEDDFVRLARKAIETFVLYQKIIDIPNSFDANFLSLKAGVFVSIRKFGTLRGCIGTILPVTNCVGKEIIRNAISAATKDSRFPKIEMEEIPWLTIKVDVLQEPEPIDSKDLLDPKRYGVIVSSGYKRGLLLPDLDGIDTVDEQIRIAMRKGNILENEDYQLERFEVVRHY